MWMRKEIKGEMCSSIAPPPTLHPLTLSDWLHLIPSSLVYRLLPPGTVHKCACEHFENLNSLCKLASFLLDALVFVQHRFSCVVFNSVNSTEVCSSSCLFDRKAEGAEMQSRQQNNYAVLLSGRMVRVYNFKCFPPFTS